ncbi:AAA family ATPase [Chroococcidiopsis sp. CCNUC1]|uniref:AAA family ATPase n=1 Tax=Chroococcidiopsis sp. CCNUC1 TaxID=2653189 RepID=UPI0020215E72|nr:AAA family ATPase [Chroococcidiopsis sp. CCNUC1]URD53509.1 MoxR family ATPase [Chroococcidiopsis sp. CCNUC1]
MAIAKNTKKLAAQIPNNAPSGSALERLQQLRRELNQIFLERSTVIDGVLAVLLTGGNVVLFGPPGCAKSWMLQQLCGAIEEAVFFDRLLQPTITPDELLGQLSLRALQQQDELIRNTKRRLPEAHIAFLDEVFRGNSTSLNALLRLMNERVFENPEPQPVPLLFLCGAANNVPTDGDLDAFVDRFVYRPWLQYVRKLGSKRELIHRARSNIKPEVKVRLSLAEIKTLQQQAAIVPFSDELAEDLIKCQLALDREGFFISDRKLQQLVKLLQAHALVQGDEQVYPESFHELLPDCLWQRDPKERQKIGQVLNACIPDLDRQAVSWYDAAKEEVGTVVRAAREYDLRPSNTTEQKLIEAADNAASRLEDIARKIEKLIADNKNRNARRAQRILTDIREDLLVEVGGYKNKVYQ